MTVRLSAAEIHRAIQMGLELNGAVRTWTQGKVLIVAIAYPPVNALNAAGTTHTPHRAGEPGS